jgi:hypothetical protein
VYACTAIASVFAYVWLVLVLQLVYNAAHPKPSDGEDSAPSASLDHLKA